MDVLADVVNSAEDLRRKDNVKATSKYRKMATVEIEVES